MKLIEAIPNWYESGIFDKLYTLFPNSLAWAKPIYNEYFKLSALDLDLDYFGDYSGNKETSTLIDKLIKIYDADVVTDEILEKLATIIYGKFNYIWNKRFTTIIVTYNMLDTYNVVKNETGSDSNIETRDLVFDGSSESNRNYEDNSSNKNTVNTDTAIYGYNSTIAAPTDVSQDITDYSGNDNGVSSNNSKDNKTEKGTISRLRTPTLKTETKGNIFTSPQKLIEGERNVWLYDYFKTVFNDIDTILTSGFYIND